MPHLSSRNALPISPHDRNDFSMSSRTKKSFAWLWMAALLTATVGVSMHHIYCYCAGKSTVSLFTLDDACTPGERTDASGCCRKPVNKPVHSCCSQDKDACSGEHDGCMEKSTRVFQLKTEFVVDKPFEKTFDCPQWIEKMPVFRRYLRSVVCEVVTFDKPPPVSLSGRDICLRLQTFRC